MTKDTYVIIPVYNEATVIDDVLKKVLKQFSNVVCVNDGSKDASAKVIAKTKARLVNHPINLGAGAATQTGIEYALEDPKAKYFITIDADGQHNIDDAVKMLSYLKKHDVDVVFGSRFLGSVKNLGGVKRQFLRLAAAFSATTTGVRLTDPHIGLRVFNRRFAKSINITLPGFAHASEIVHQIAEGQFSYAEIPVTVTYSAYSKAKGQSMINAINITVDLLVNRANKQ